MDGAEEVNVFKEIVCSSWIPFISLQQSFNFVVLEMELIMTVWTRLASSLWGRTKQRLLVLTKVAGTLTNHSETLYHPHEIKSRTSLEWYGMHKSYFQVNDLIVEAVCLVLFFHKPSARTENLKHHLISFTIPSLGFLQLHPIALGATFWPGAPGWTPVLSETSLLCRSTLSSNLLHQCWYCFLMNWFSPGPHPII